MKKLLLTGALSLSLLSINVNAASFQSFSSMSYHNPALISLVKKYKAKVGGYFRTTRVDYNGFHQGVTGKSTSRKNAYLPYFDLAARVHDDIVVGLALSNPTYVDIQHDNGPLAREAIRLKGRTLTPKISFKLHKAFYLGVGLDIQFLEGRLNFLIPGTQAALGQRLLWENNVKETRAGYSIGGLLFLKENIFIQAWYNSGFTLFGKGDSKVDGQPRKDLTATLSLPQTFSLSYTHILTPKFLFSATARLIRFSPTEDIKIKTTTGAGVPGFGPALANGTDLDLKFHNAYEISGVMRYQFHDMFAGLLGGGYESSPVGKKTRRAVLPSDRVIKGFVGLQFIPNKNWEVQALYGIGQNNSKILQFNPAAVGGGVGSNGKTKGMAHVIDVSATFKM